MTETKKSSSWDQRFLDLAKHLSGWSKDPSTKVGCVVVGPDREIRATGFNGFPRGIADDGRLAVREQKISIICHAEENAIMNAARVGVSLKGCSAFVTWPPCTRCARSLIQAGITRVVFPKTEVPERWRDDFEISTALMHESGIQTIEVADEIGWLEQQLTIPEVRRAYEEAAAEDALNQRVRMVVEGACKEHALTKSELRGYEYDGEGGPARGTNMARALLSLLGEEA